MKVEDIYGDLPLNIKIDSQNIVDDQLVKLLEDNPVASIEEVLHARARASNYGIPLELAFDIGKTFKQTGKLPSKSVIKSKIMITAFAGLAAIIFTRFGIDLPADQITDLMAAEGSLILGIIAVLRAFFTFEKLH